MGNDARREVAFGDQRQGIGALGFKLGESASQTCAFFVGFDVARRVLVNNDVRHVPIEHWVTAVPNPSFHDELIKVF